MLFKIVINQLIIQFGHHQDFTVDLNCKKIWAFNKMHKSKAVNVPDILQITFMSVI